MTLTLAEMQTFLFKKKLSNLPKIFSYTFREGSSASRKIGKTKGLSFANVFWNVPKLSLLTKKNKTLYKLPKYEPIKILVQQFLKAKTRTHLLINKGPSYLFKKLNWKFRLNFHEIITKNVCKLLRLVN